MSHIKGQKHLIGLFKQKDFILATLLIGNFDKLAQFLSMQILFGGCMMNGLFLKISFLNIGFCCHLLIQSRFLFVIVSYQSSQLLKTTLNRSAIK